MANDLLKYGAIGALLYGGYRYYKAYKVGSNLEIEISGVMANAISKNNFSIGVNLDVTNKSTERITLSNSNLKCYINGRYVGVAKVPYTQIINASTTTKVFVVVDVFYKEVFAEWWNMFVQLATTVKLTIAGSLKFNGVYVPIPAIDIKEFKMSELFESPKVSGCNGWNESEYINAINTAQSLPQNGDWYYLNDENTTNTLPVGCFVCNDEQIPNPVSIYYMFKTVPFGKGYIDGFYTKTIPTYNEKGNMNPKRLWDEKLFFHPKWARNDIEVSDVDFDIVGIKRKTSKLPAGVILKNIRFLY